LINIFVLFSVWRTRGPKTKCFPNTDWAASGTPAFS